MRNLLFFLLFISVSLSSLISIPKGFNSYFYGHQLEYPYCFAVLFDNQVTIVVSVMRLTRSTVEEITTLYAETKRVKPQLLFKGKEPVGKIEFISFNKEWVYYIFNYKPNLFILVSFIFNYGTKKSRIKELEKWVLDQNWKNI